MQVNRLYVPSMQNESPPQYALCAHKRVYFIIIVTM